MLELNHSFLTRVITTKHSPPLSKIYARKVCNFINCAPYLSVGNNQPKPEFVKAQSFSIARLSPTACPQVYHVPLLQVHRHSGAQVHSN